MRFRRADVGGSKRLPEPYKAVQAARAGDRAARGGELGRAGERRPREPGAAGCSLSPRCQQSSRNPSRPPFAGIPGVLLRLPREEGAVAACPAWRPFGAAGGRASRSPARPGSGALRARPPSAPGGEPRPSAARWCSAATCWDRGVRVRGGQHDPVGHQLAGKHIKSSSTPPLCDSPRSLLEERSGGVPRGRGPSRSVRWRLLVPIVRVAASLPGPVPPIRPSPSHSARE